MQRRHAEPQQVEAAIDFLKEFAMDRAKTVSYSRVFAAAGLEAPQELHQGSDSHLVTEFMKAIHDRCAADRDLPPLDALVVHVTGKRENWPGAGYFTVNGLPDPKSERRIAEEEQIKATNFWIAEQEACKQWGTKARRGR